MEKEKKLLDPKNDLVFHTMFREKNNKLTESFISSVLKEDVKIISNLDRHLDISKTIEKFGIMDLNVELADKTKCNVEMQVVEHTGELERFLYYLANSYARQLKKNEVYGEIHRCTNIVIVNHEIEELKDTKGFISKWTMKNETGENELTNKFELYIIILPRVEKYYNESGEDKLVDWCKFFVDPYSMEVKDIMTRNKDIKEAGEELEILNGDYEIQRLAELREKAIRDEASALDFATKKGLKAGLEQGLKEGLEEGRKKGMEQGIEQVAKNLLKMGLSISDISKATGLTKEEILNLK